MNWPLILCFLGLVALIAICAIAYTRNMENHIRKWRERGGYYDERTIDELDED